MSLLRARSTQRGRSIIHNGKRRVVISGSNYSELEWWKWMEAVDVKRSLFCSAEGNECIKASVLSCGECIQVGAKCGWCTDTVSSIQIPRSICSLTLQTQYINAELHSYSCWLIRDALMHKHDIVFIQHLTKEEVNIKAEHNIGFNII